MLTGLKVTSLVQKCLFYRPELTGKSGLHGTEIKFLKLKSWNVSTDRAQRIHEKKWVIRLVMFTPRVMVIKTSKMAVYIVLDTAKNQFQFGQII